MKNELLTIGPITIYMCALMIALRLEQLVIWSSF